MSLHLLQISCLLRFPGALPKLQTAQRRGTGQAAAHHRVGLAGRNGLAELFSGLGDLEAAVLLANSGNAKTIKNLNLKKKNRGISNKPVLM